MPKLHIDLNTRGLMSPHAHGFHDKDVVVLHETVSHDAPSLSDIRGVENYLAGKDYGIHGVTDREGNIAWAVGLGRAVFWHCGGVNERSIGIEQVFIGAHDQPRDRLLWVVRQKELRATAKLLSAIHKAHGVPLRYSDGDHPGITSHWNVSQHHPSSLGHWDCHPIHLGGYYPMLKVIQLARNYSRAGVHF